MKRKISMMILTGFTPLLSMAHPGHGETGGFTITHYIVEPVHLFAAICLLSITIALYSYIKRSTKPAKKIKCV